MGDVPVSFVILTRLYVKFSDIVLKLLTNGNNFWNGVIAKNKEYSWVSKY